MAWSVPPTFAGNSALTAADLNTTLRDCMNETMPAKATIPGSYFVTSATNTIVQRTIKQATVSATETRTLTSFGDLTTVGPSVTVTTGTKAMFVVTAQISNSTVGAYSIVSYSATGATSISASDEWALLLKNAGSTQNMAVSHVSFQTLTAGSHTVTMKYRVTSGTGTFLRRRLIVIPF